MTKKIAVHKHLLKCLITEMEKDNEDRYFTAVICGWKNFKFYSATNDKSQQLFEKVTKKVEEIRNLIEKNDNCLNDLSTIFFL